MIEVEPEHASQLFALGMALLAIIAGSIVLAIGAAVRSFLSRRK
jgi:hypothetical protein